METLKWYAGKVRDIKPGEFEAELSENVEEIFYNLTVDETDGIALAMTHCQ